MSVPEPRPLSLFDAVRVLRPDEQVDLGAAERDPLAMKALAEDVKARGRERLAAARTPSR